MSSYTLNHNNKYDDEYDFEGKIRTELVNTFGVKFANELDTQNEPSLSTVIFEYGTPDAIS